MKARFVSAVHFLVSALAVLTLAGVIAGYGGTIVYALDTMAHLRAHLGLVALGTGLFAAILWNWQVVFISASALLLSLAGLGVLWQTPPAPGQGPQITVMTANLCSLNTQPEAMRAALATIDADILVTNETTKTVQRGVGALTDRYPYRLALSTTGETLRTVLWSRFPMRDGRLLLHDGITPTGAHAVIEVAPGVEIGVLGVHFAHGIRGNQRKQVDALSMLAERLPETRIVLGDFNATPWSLAVRRAERLTGTRALINGFHPTWFGPCRADVSARRIPLGLPIDHILVSPGIGTRVLRTVPIPGSDHAAILGVLTLPMPQGGEEKTRVSPE